MDNLLNRGTTPLLVSEDKIKGVTAISDNLDAKYIRSAILEAQDIELREVLGSRLYRKVCALVTSREIYQPSNEIYRALLDESQYFLAYQSAIYLVDNTTFKLGNFGLCRAKDENLENATEQERASQRGRFQKAVDHQRRLLQTWIIENKGALPELSTGKCREIVSHLTTSATCGVFLGGARGKY